MNIPYFKTFISHCMNVTIILLVAASQTAVTTFLQRQKDLSRANGTVRAIDKLLPSFSLLLAHVRVITLGTTSQLFRCLCFAPLPGIISEKSGLLVTSDINKIKSPLSYNSGSLFKLFLWKT